jgi:small nuclear ribonucleoprotein (snRNP)-like protein
MDQPFDTLRLFKDKVVTLVKKDGSEVTGKLVASDLNLNITIETIKGLEFINGFAVDQIILKEDK